MAPTYATDTILLGVTGQVNRGEKVPETYITFDGTTEDTDFARLEELGLVSDKPVKDEVAADPDAPAEAPNLSELKVPQLKALASERGVEVKGSGKRGAVIKLDLVNALSD